MLKLASENLMAYSMRLSDRLHMKDACFSETLCWLQWKESAKKLTAEARGYAPPAEREFIGSFADSAAKRKPMDMNVLMKQAPQQIKGLLCCLYSRVARQQRHGVEDPSLRGRASEMTSDENLNVAFAAAYFDKANSKTFLQECGPRSKSGPMAMGPEPRGSAELENKLAHTFATIGMKIITFGPTAMGPEPRGCAELEQIGAPPCKN